MVVVGEADETAVGVASAAERRRTRPRVASSPEPSIGGARARGVRAAGFDLARASKTARALAHEQREHGEADEGALCLSGNGRQRLRPASPPEGLAGCARRALHKPGHLRGTRTGESRARRAG